MAKAAPQPEYNIVLKQPALFATIITIVIAGVFLGALWNSASHGHGPAHGATPAVSNSARGPDGMPAKGGAPPPASAPGAAAPTSAPAR
jgi:hypothetical protein